MISKLEQIVPLVPHLSDYFGLWSVDEKRFRVLADYADSLDLFAHVQARQAQAEAGERPALAVPDPDGEPAARVAVVPLQGLLMKRPDSLSGGTSTIRAIRQLQLAARDPNVDGVFVPIDSPGGTVAGTDDLAEAVAETAAEKPVVAYIADLGASAAYFAASQATRVYANRSGMVGAIGTFGVVIDSSKRAESEGIKVHVIRAGRFKGAGTPGTEITAEQLETFQQEVDEQYALFVSAVARGRGLSADQAADLADGRVHIAAAAEQLKLIDGVRNERQAVAELRTLITQNRSSVEMPDNKQTPEVPQAATFDELTAACSGADPDFLCKAQAQKLTVEQARDAWLQQLNERAAAAEQRAQEAEAKAEAAETERAKAAERVGVEPVTGGGRAAADEEGTAAERFNTAVLAEMDRGTERRAAVSAVIRRDPDLHKAYLLETNPNKRAQRMIEEKYS